MVKENKNINGDVENKDLTQEEAKVTVENEAEEIKKQEKEAKETAKKLKQDLVEIKIPEDLLNPKDKVVDVFINGYRWSIERGKEVKVPREVKKILEGAKYI